MIFFFISLSTYFCFLVLKYRKILLELNKQKFDLKKNGTYIIKHAKEIFLTSELFGFILLIVVFNVDAKVMGICTVIFYTLMFLYELKNKKDKLKINKKIIVTAVTILIIYLLVSLGFCLDYYNLQNDFLIFDHTWLYYIIVILMAELAYFIGLGAAFISSPIRKLIDKKSKHK